MSHQLIGLFELAFLLLIVVGPPAWMVAHTLRPSGPTEEEVEQAVQARVQPALEEMFVTGYEHARRELNLD